jgi:hypothetical protein
MAGQTAPLRQGRGAGGDVGLVGCDLSVRYLARLALVLMESGGCDLHKATAARDRSWPACSSTNARGAVSARHQVQRHMRAHACVRSLLPNVVRTESAGAPAEAQTEMELHGTFGMWLHTLVFVAGR